MRQRGGFGSSVRLAPLLREKLIRRSGPPAAAACAMFSCGALPTGTQALGSGADCSMEERPGRTPQ